METKTGPCAGKKQPILPLNFGKARLHGNRFGVKNGMAIVKFAVNQCTRRASEPDLGFHTKG